MIPAPSPFVTSHCRAPDQSLLKARVPAIGAGATRVPFHVISLVEKKEGPRAAGILRNDPAVPP